MPTTLLLRGPLLSPRAPPALPEGSSATQAAERKKAGPVSFRFAASARPSAKVNSVTLFLMAKNNSPLLGPGPASAPQTRPGRAHHPPSFGAGGSLRPAAAEDALPRLSPATLPRLVFPPQGLRRKQPPGRRSPPLRPPPRLTLGPPSNSRPPARRPQSVSPYPSGAGRAEPGRSAPLIARRERGEETTFRRRLTRE